MYMSDLKQQTNVNSDAVDRLLTNKVTQPGSMTNQEVEELGTTETAAVDLHITRHTKQPVIIEPADAPGEVYDENNRK
jgi:hypothetical protein